MTGRKDAVEASSELDPRTRRLRIERLRRQIAAKRYHVAAEDVAAAILATHRQGYPPAR